MNPAPFEERVIKKSHEVPVVVDFWAPWCGPCQTLGPIIEELSFQAEGKWKLEKVNTDREQAVATQYRIRSIPALKIFHKGEIIAEMTGALPRNQLLEWIEKNIPTEEGEAWTGLKEEFLRNPIENKAALENFIAGSPENTEAKLYLAFAEVFSNAEFALELAESGSSDPGLREQVEDIRVLAEWMKSEASTEAGAGLKMGAAREALQSGDFDAAHQFLVEAVMIDKTWENELPRRASVAMFRFWGTGHELSKKYRRRFDMALY